MIHLFLVRLNSTVWTSYRCIKRIVPGRLAWTRLHACTVIATALRHITGERASGEDSGARTALGRRQLLHYTTRQCHDAHVTDSPVYQSVSRTALGRPTDSVWLCSVYRYAINQSINQWVWWCDVMWLLPIATGQGKSTPRHPYDIN